MTTEETKAELNREFEKLSREFLVEKWDLAFRERNRGKCYYKHELITVPEFAFDWLHGHDFALAYMLHEFAHILTRGDGHGAKFQNAEDALLARYGMFIVRRKVYLEVLFRHGSKVWDRQEAMWRKINGGA